MLEVKDLNVNINKSQILTNVSLSIFDGEILGLVGESGSGKTMTSLAVAGLLPNSADISGSIILDDTRLDTMSSGERRKYNGRSISFVFQEPMTSLNPVMKVGKQIEEILVIHTSLNKEERKKEVLEIMKKVELPNVEELYDKYPNELSGGMRQRVVIAMAAVLKPSLIIADEPTTALDTETGEAILGLIKKINRENETKVLIISHDLNVVKNTCNRVAVMKDGNIVEVGSVEEIFNNPKNEYTKLLIESVNKVEKENKVEADETIVSVSNLSLYYKEKSKEKIISQNINFSIKKGEILGLLGRSGCGKSTLSRVLTGLAKNYHGNILSDISEKQGIQMVFQDPYSSLNQSKTIGFLLSEPLKNKGGYSKSEIKKEVLQILDKVGLGEEYYRRYPDELSGGQRQRVSIGIALISKPQLIVADEPVSALDVTVQKQILELLLDLQKKLNISILMISHDKEVLNEVCDRIVTWEEITGRNL